MVERASGRTQTLFATAADRVRLVLPGPNLALALLLLAAALCRIVWLTLPAHALIFDETYYVNAARVILGWAVPAGSPYAGQLSGIDPNSEHPPLGKLIIALSMRAFGDNAIGWRLPSVVGGTASVWLISRIVLAAGGGKWLGVVASAIFAFDNLSLVHARIGTLDMLFVSLLLLGAWLYLRHQPLYAGIACALSALVKLTAAYGLLALLLFEVVSIALAWRGRDRFDVMRLAPAGALLLAFAVTWVAGLWILDLRFGVYHTPWDHLQHMLNYGFALTRSGGPANIESYPWQWLINEVQIPYLRVDEQVSVNGTVVTVRPLVYFRGAMNPIVIGAAPLGLAYALWTWWRQRSVLGLWCVTWIGGNYLPYFPLSLEHRIMYLYYFLPSLPAVTVSIAVLLFEARLPRVVLWGYLIGLLLGFIGYFPFRTFP